MVLIWDGNSEISEHVRSNLCYFICLMHLIMSKHLQIRYFFIHACATCYELSSNISTMYGGSRVNPQEEIPDPILEKNLNPEWFWKNKYINHLLHNWQRIFFNMFNIYLFWVNFLDSDVQTKFGSNNPLKLEIGNSDWSTMLLFNLATGGHRDFVYRKLQAPISSLKIGPKNQS